jgi:hypothetical protein
MRQHLLAIDAATEYFANIPKQELTPETAALDELFSSVSGDALREVLFDDVEIMEDNFADPKQQDEFWFGAQHVLYVQAARLALYYPLVQKAARQYGFEIPSADKVEPMTGREYYQQYVLRTKKQVG